MTMSLILGVQLAIASAVGAGLVGACRWLRRRSPLCGAVVVAGVLLRAAVMLALFWTSYLDLPGLRQQHTRDGFWKLAVDSGVYYGAAANAAENGLDTIARGSASPAFTETLALWMRVAGSSPISGGYLNLVLYVLLCVMMVAAFKPAANARTDLPCAVGLAAMSFSPLLVFVTSQPLKDALFVFLMGSICAAAATFLPSLTLDGGKARGAGVPALGLGAIVVPALYLIGGIRAYYAVVVWTGLALVLFVFAWRQGRGRIVRYASVCILLLATAWLAYKQGADLDYINPYAAFVGRSLRPSADPATAATIEPAGSVVALVDKFRTGFVLTPGATNVQPRKKPASRRPHDGARPVAASTGDAAPGSLEDSAPSSVTVGRSERFAAGVRARLSALGIGLGLIFVPVSLLRAWSIVDFTGGRGLLAITDVDTVFIDLTIVAVIAVLVRGRSALRERLSYACFAATIAVAATLLMAYIVTNFGTLFRLRLMAVAPLWMLPLALGPRLRGKQEDDVARLAARTRASFGYEWTHFNRWQDSAETSFRDCFETADLPALRGSRVLDAGCGMGRHARQMASHARHVVAVDFSHAIEQAAINTRGAGRVDCVQADVLRLPFADGTFDYVYCLGVLHHLGNTDTALRALVDQLKPGGRLRVYLYWNRQGGLGAVLRLVTAARSLTTRLPFRLLRWLCWLLSVVLWLAVILPYRLLVLAGVRGLDNWPLFVYARYPFRILYNDQFDRFSAPLEKRYGREEVTALLATAGLQDVRVEPRFGWIAEGVKPAGQGPCAA